MNLSERISEGKYSFLHIYVYDNNGNQILHAWFAPSDVEMFENLLSAQNNTIDMMIEIDDNAEYDESYDVYEFTCKGNDYMIMFSEEK